METTTIVNDVIVNGYVDSQLITQTCQLIDGAILFALLVFTCWGAYKLFNMFF